LLLNCLFGGSHRRLLVYISSISRDVAAFDHVIASAQINWRRHVKTGNTGKSLYKCASSGIENVTAALVINKILCYTCV
jgi:hypothetical protein